MRRLLVLLALLLIPVIADAQVVTTEETHGSIKKIAFAWTSDGLGDASGTTSEAYNGKIVGLVTNPDDTAVPTAAYDVTVTDQDGVDVLAGSGADLSATLTEQVADETALGIVANDTLTVTVANAGASKQGVVYVYIR